MIGLAPIHIQPLLEIHCFPLEKDHLYCNEKIYRTLREMGLITARGTIVTETGGTSFDIGYSKWQTSDKGRIYIEALEAVPLPVKQWAIPVHEGQ